MLHTGKGDDGTTEIRGSSGSVRVSKVDPRVEALGSLDELNSLLGLCKAKLGKEDIFLEEQRSLEGILQELQEDLFIVQAELIGATRKISLERVRQIEILTNFVEKETPPVNSFVVSGNLEISAYLDLARSVARRAERRVVAVETSKLLPVSKEIKTYLNYLSDLLFALARLTDHKFGINEERSNVSKDI